MKHEQTDLEKLRIKSDMMNEADLKGELSDKELDELSDLKELLELIESETNG